LHERGEDENLKESMHRYINTNERKKRMFNKFNTEEKYSRPGGAGCFGASKKSHT
jgi:hypothetical protein